MVEWNENEGTVKRAYQGFNKRSLEVVQFDTSRDRYLAAGDDYLVKFWDMDKSTVLATTNAEGGLMVSFLLGVGFKTISLRGKNRGLTCLFALMLSRQLHVFDLTRRALC